MISGFDPAGLFNWEREGVGQVVEFSGDFKSPEGEVTVITSGVEALCKARSASMEAT